MTAVHIQSREVSPSAPPAVDAGNTAHAARDMANNVAAESSTAVARSTRRRYVQPARRAAAPISPAKAAALALQLPCELRERVIGHIADPALKLHWLELETRHVNYAASATLAQQSECFEKLFSGLDTASARILLLKGPKAALRLVADPERMRTLAIAVFARSLRPGQPPTPAVNLLAADMPIRLQAEMLNVLVREAQAGRAAHAADALTDVFKRRATQHEYTDSEVIADARLRVEILRAAEVIICHLPDPAQKVAFLGELMLSQIQHDFRYIGNDFSINRYGKHLDSNAALNTILRAHANLVMKNDNYDILNITPEKEGLLSPALENIVSRSSINEICDPNLRALHVTRIFESLYAPLTGSAKFSTISHRLRKDLQKSAIDLLHDDSVSQHSKVAGTHMFLNNQARGGWPSHDAFSAADTDFNEQLFLHVDRAQSFVEVPRDMRSALLTHALEVLRPDQMVGREALFDHAMHLLHDPATSRKIRNGLLTALGRLSAAQEIPVHDEEFLRIFRRDAADSSFTADQVNKVAESLAGEITPRYLALFHDLSCFLAQKSPAAQSILDRLTEQGAKVCALGALNHELEPLHLELAEALAVHLERLSALPRRENSDELFSLMKSNKLPIPLLRRFVKTISDKLITPHPGRRDQHAFDRHQCTLSLLHHLENADAAAALGSSGARALAGKILDSLKDVWLPHRRMIPVSLLKCALMERAFSDPKLEGRIVAKLADEFRKVTEKRKDHYDAMQLLHKTSALLNDLPVTSGIVAHEKRELLSAMHACLQTLGYGDAPIARLQSLGYLPKDC